LYFIIAILWFFFILILIASFVFFFKFYPLILDLLNTKLHNLFWFIFYEIILILWPGSWVWGVSHVDSGYFFFIFNYYYFLNFIFQYWIDCELDFIILFWFFSIGLSQFHNLYHKFYGLTRLNWVFFLIKYLFFNFVL